MKTPLKFLMFLVLHAFACTELSGQHLKVNADKISELIEQWNSIHNRRADAAFVEVYEGELFYYAERISQSKATLLKKLLFVRNPEYQQRVNGPVKIEVYNNGFVKCDFTREIWQNSKWSSTSMYLLIRYNDLGYWIIGESDYQTDKRFGFIPRLGDALQSKFLPLNTDYPSAALLAKTNLHDGFAITQLVPPTTISVLLIVALISSGVVMILRRNTTFQNYLNSIDLEESVIDNESPIDETNPSEETNARQYNLNQDRFRDYLLKLFDPTFFKYEKQNQSHLPETSGSPVGFMSNLYNKIHFQFRRHSTDTARFTIQYFYTKEAQKEMKLFSPELLSRFKQDDKGDLYIVIGIAGCPEDPNDIYLLPSGKIKSDTFTTEELHQFKKYGLFSFSHSQNRLH